MGDHAVGLAVLGLRSARVRREKDGEQQALQGGEFGVQVCKGACQVIRGQVGKDGKGAGVVNIRRDAGKVEIWICDQLSGGQPVFVHQFQLVAALHKWAGQIRAPVMAGIKIGHGFAAKAQ